MNFIQGYKVVGIKFFLTLYPCFLVTFKIRIFIFLHKVFVGFDILRKLQLFVRFFCLILISCLIFYLYRKCCSVGNGNVCHAIM